MQCWRTKKSHQAHVGIPWVSRTLWRGVTATGPALSQGPGLPAAVPPPAPHVAGWLVTVPAVSSEVLIHTSRSHCAGPPTQAQSSGPKGDSGVSTRLLSVLATIPRKGHPVFGSLWGK